MNPNLMSLLAGILPLLQRGANPATTGTSATGALPLPAGLRPGETPLTPGQANLLPAGIAPSDVAAVEPSPLQHLPVPLANGSNFALLAQQIGQLNQPRPTGEMPHAPAPGIRPEPVRPATGIAGGPGVMPTQSPAAPSGAPPTSIGAFLLSPQGQMLMRQLQSMGTGGGM